MDLARLKESITKGKESAYKSLETITDGLSLGLQLGTVVMIPVLAFNGLVYSVSAGMEGVERAAGVKAQTYVAKLKEKHVALGPGGQRHNYCVFEEKGREFTVYDYPVVTELSFLPHHLDKMQTGKEYRVKVFGSQKWLTRLVDAKEK